MRFSAAENHKVSRNELGMYYKWPHPEKNPYTLLYSKGKASPLYSREVFTQRKLNL